VELDRRGRRPLARACLDWTERRPHLAGAAGAALCRHALDQGWCVRIGSGRAVKVTAEGVRALTRLLGVDAAALR
ncbi:transcriptional regulator, partial [Actinospica acidiphila]|nr:transcriptional regulator [Actinospica acidiphila]